MYADLLRAGMCNRFFAWAYAMIYSNQHQSPVAINGWYKTPIGPWIRREKIKRFYALYFKDQSDIVGFFWRKLTGRSKILFNPGLDDPWDQPQYPTVIFDSIPNSREYFDALQGYNGFLKNALWNITSNKVKNEVTKLLSPEIGVHIRRGDFVHGMGLESFDFYKKAISYIRQQFGDQLKVTVFSDGYPSELQEILDLPNTSFQTGASDLAELWQLSKSQYIVTSHKSTFSYWAAYLSDALVIHNVKYEDKPIRWGVFENHEGLLIERPKNPITADV